jgi:DNA-binding NarL/FixJ family response regulator
VALLVAAGKTNRQIASELGMANRTVDTHVRNLLRKLKLSSRTDVAAWAVSNGLVADDASSD